MRNVPVISHEIGEWCVYPNFDEIPKYKGYLKPKNFEIFRDTLRAHGMADLARQFLLASGKLQTLCYKEDIESALRTPGMGGFELLDLHDFPGQGTALVGVLDPFWDDKGYVTAGGIQPLLQPHRALGAAEQARLHVRRNAARRTSKWRTSARRRSGRPSSIWKLVGCDGKSLPAGCLRANIPVDNDIPWATCGLSWSAVARAI